MKMRNWIPVGIRFFIKEYSGLVRGVFLIMTRTEFVEKSINGELQLIKFFYGLEKCITAYKCSITATAGI
jgi:hypothetical protein